MSLSTVVEWLNENENRAYPLTSNSTRYLVKGRNTYDLYPVILDAMLVFTTLVTSVSLTKIKAVSGDLTITLSADSTLIEFIITDYKNVVYPQYLRDTNQNLLVVGAAATSLPDNITFEVVNTAFEPSVIYEMLPDVLGVSDLTIGDHLFTGNIVLSDGVQLSFTPNKNAIAFEVGRNEGIPLGCGDYSAGTPDCGAVVSSVNGVTPNKTGNPIFFTGKNHVTVYDDPDSNRVYIGLDFTAADIPEQKLSRPPKLI